MKAILLPLLATSVGFLKFGITMDPCEVSSILMNRYIWVQDILYGDRSQMYLQIRDIIFYGNSCKPGDDTELWYYMGWFNSVESVCVETIQWIVVLLIYG
jgi:hypothetical protein